MRPRIGVTGPDRGGTTAWIFTAIAIWRSGGWPKRITPIRPAGIEDLDGLVIGGGIDLNPSLYGEEMEEAIGRFKREAGSRTGNFARWLLFPLIYILRRIFSTKDKRLVDEGRDTLEVSLVRKAIKKGIPLLGICRGSQLINAALGGNLHREVRDFYVETPYVKSIFPKKVIEVIPGSLLSSILGASNCRVNALNHQAVKDPAPELKISAQEKNGLVQAIEHKTLPFVLGVQWHPEYLPHVSIQQRIFRQLVDLAGKAQKRHEATL